MKSIEKRYNDEMKARAKKQKEQERKANALRKYRENATEEQKQADLAKAQLTREDKKIVKKAIYSAMNGEYMAFINGEVIKSTGVEALAFDIMSTALRADTPLKDKISAFTMLADYSGNKPSEKKEVTQNTTVTWESMMSKFNENPQEQIDLNETIDVEAVVDEDEQ